MEYAIILEGLTKNFKHVTAVDNLSLKVKKGEIFGLLGPNGAGKTTAISIMTTIYKPSSGDVIVDSYNLKKDPDKMTYSQRPKGRGF